MSRNISPTKKTGIMFLIYIDFSYCSFDKNGDSYKKSTRYIIFSIDSLSIISKELILAR